jgi:hypothetical protein
VLLWVGDAASAPSPPGPLGWVGWLEAVPVDVHSDGCAAA